MRMLLGLDRPTGGTVTVNGRSYAEHPAPLREVGALLEARAAVAGRSAYHHLLALAATHGLPKSRVVAVLDLVGIGDVAHKRVGAFSLGMGQRLGIAVALLGDPATLVLDEPVNGLDPDGVLWVRRLLTQLAAEGRTIFVSSHLLSEMALVASHLIVIGRGRILADTDMKEFLDRAEGRHLRVRSPERARLGAILAGAGGRIAADGDAIRVSGLGIEAVGEAAAANGIVLHELTDHRASLEDAFMNLTSDAVEYRGHATVPTGV